MGGEGLTIGGDGLDGCATEKPTFGFGSGGGPAVVNIFMNSSADANRLSSRGVRPAKSLVKNFRYFGVHIARDVGPGRSFTGEKFIENHDARVKIRPPVDLRTAPLLGRHVIERARDVATGGRVKRLRVGD